MTTNRNMHVIAGVIAGIVHLAVVGAVWGAAAFDGDRFAARAAQAAPVSIEAGLAVRAKNQAGRKTKQPQKDIVEKVKPDAEHITTNDDPTKKPPEVKKDKTPPEDQDPESIFKKHREGSTGTPDPAAATPGGDNETKAGKADGSDYGTIDENKGDPYLGELAGRLKEHFVVPSTVPENQKLKAYGCAKLRPDGSYAEVFLDEDRKSPNAALNSAVLRSLKQASPMVAPVPPTLKAMLEEQGVCTNFDY